MFVNNRIGLLEGVETLLVQERRMSQVSNNLANANTTGFKQETVTFWEVLHNTTASEPRVGKALKTLTNFEQGPASLTGNPLDITIDGEGFLRVQTEQGIRYSRDGNLHRNSQGQVVNSNGEAVLGQGGAITLAEGNVTIDNDGQIFLNGELVDQFAVVTFADLTGLEKEGNNNFRIKGEDVQEQAALDYQIRQGYIEASNVNTVREMTEMLDLYRAYESQQKIIRTIDDVDDEAIRRVGKLT